MFASIPCTKTKASKATIQKRKLSDKAARKRLLAPITSTSWTSLDKRKLKLETCQILLTKMKTRHFSKASSSLRNFFNFLWTKTQKNSAKMLRQKPHWKNCHSQKSKNGTVKYFRLFNRRNLPGILKSARKPCLTKVRQISILVQT